MDSNYFQNSKLKKKKDGIKWLHLKKQNFPFLKQRALMLRKLLI